MNRRIHGRRWLKIIFVVGLFLLPGLLLTPFFRKETFPPPEFSDRIFKLRQWTNKGWTGYPRKEERQLLDDLCGYVQAESNTVHREILYAQFTNELINVPFFSTNGVQRTNEFPRGWYQPPYRDRTMFYRSLARLSTFASTANFFRGVTPRDGMVCRESSRIASRNAVS